MSKRHQISRRRIYGRRQHELNERLERYAGALGLNCQNDRVAVPGPKPGPLARRIYASWQIGEAG
jgi:hypothetical protein